MDQNNGLEKKSKVILWIIIGIVILAIIVAAIIIFSSKGNEPTAEYFCDKDRYNCDDFVTQEQAQSVFDSCGGIDNDIHGLDRDSNGLACESLE